MLGSYRSQYIDLRLGVSAASVSDERLRQFNAATILAGDVSSSSASRSPSDRPSDASARRRPARAGASTAGPRPIPVHGPRITNHDDGRFGDRGAAVR